MAYIGKEPIVGNFQVCDTISTSATDTFNLLVSSVAVFPETENNVICSLNGVVQKPGSGGGFTISGSTIIFNSALTSADVIDFILILGSVLSVGTPTDRTVTLAKMSTGTDGNIISYDASGNPVAIATGNDGQVLTSAGAGQPPAFEAAAADLVKILTQTLSGNVSSVDFIHGTNGCVLDSTYEYYIVKFSGIFFDAQGGLAARIGTSGGFITASDYHMNEASLLSNGSAWVLNQSQVLNSIRISDRRYTNTTAGFNVSGEVRFYNMSSTSLYKGYWTETVGFGNSASEVSYIAGSGMLEDSTSKGAVNDRIQFLPLSASNIASGSFTLYGVKK